jgi:hypothetical protein
MLLSLSSSVTIRMEYVSTTTSHSSTINRAWLQQRILLWMLAYAHYAHVREVADEVR